MEKIIVLILVLMEDTLGGGIDYDVAGTVLPVLILVLMEDTLGVNFLYNHLNHRKS